MSPLDLPLTLNEEQVSLFQSQLLTWFKDHGRHDLPWQTNKTPYRVWVSEIMLQQTQVKTASPYYLRFMTEFPSLSSLAKASQDDVLALWSGLGYYSRARNLHKAAQVAVADFNGNLPINLEQLVSLPGIGRSTAGAILALSSNQRTPIQDGNVRRVLSRVFLIEGDLSKANKQKLLWQLADDLTPEHDVADYTQAIMDLGATLCTRSKPNCTDCPFANFCQAKAVDKQADYPQKKQTKPIPRRSEYFLLCLANDQLLMEQRPNSGIWGKLWCPPNFQSIDEAKQFCNLRQIDCTAMTRLEPIIHRFSHYQLTLNPIVVQTTRANQVAESGQQWLMPEQWLKRGIPTPIKQILNLIQTDNKG